MMFNDRIKQLREDRQIPQRKLAAALDIDTAVMADGKKMTDKVLGIVKKNIN
jgi:DNA-binding transcriptional regulator YiaG